MICAGCGSAVNEQTGWHQVVGYEQRRTQGGLNTLALRRRTGKIVCNACVATRKTEVAAGLNPTPLPSSPTFNLTDPAVRRGLRDLLDTFYPDSTKGP
jgi:hypothetical protein